MTITIIVVALVLCTVAMFYVAVRSRRNHAVQRPVDIKAFRTLSDRSDENFLRAKLPRANFVQIKRQRVRLTWKYVACMSGNAAVVFRLVEGARLSPDPQIAQQAAHAIEQASQIRMHCLVSYAKLAAEFAFPSLQLTPVLLETKYESLRDTVAQLASLQSHNEAPVAVAI
jgi:hypothetical protein